MQVDLKILKDSRISRHGMALFSIVHNEAYFLPFLFEHYRRLGVEHFLFYDDGSSDGSREFLERQPDCAIVTSDIRYGALIGNGTRYCHVLKASVPRHVFGDRWVLTVDADEFLLLPEPFADLKSLCAAIENAGGSSAVAALVDFYPETLNMRNYPMHRSPFSVNRFCDRGPLFNWKQGRRRPASLFAGVRYRIAEMLYRRHKEEYRRIFQDDLHKPSKLWKVPLVNYASGHRIVDSHGLDVAPFLGLQMVFAHFKFYPGLDGKILHALESKSYYESSREYRMLERAMHYFGNEPLLCDRSIQFKSLCDLEQASLLRRLQISEVNTPTSAN
jgi:hypothetical protein